MQRSQRSAARRLTPCVSSLLIVGGLVTAQPDLWSMARSTDPDTSWAAAADALVNADTDRARVLEMHRAHPEGLTDFELAELMGRQQTSVGKRRGELRDRGLIEHAGFKRAAPSGSMSIVWRVVRITAVA